MRDEKDEAWEEFERRGRRDRQKYERLLALAREQGDQEGIDAALDALAELRKTEERGQE